MSGIDKTRTYETPSVVDLGEAGEEARMTSPGRPAEQVSPTPPLNLRNYVVRYQGQDFQIPYEGYIFREAHARIIRVRGSGVLDGSVMNGKIIKVQTYEINSLNISGVEIFAGLHTWNYGLYAEIPTGAIAFITIEGYRSPSKVIEGYEWVPLMEGHHVLTINGDPIEFTVIPPIAARGFYGRVLSEETSESSEFIKRAIFSESGKALFEVGRFFQAHGTRYLGPLLSIAAEGKIAASR